MDRPKRPPPVPKFQDKNDKEELQKKLSSFINSISPTPATPINPQPVQSIKPENSRPEVKQQPGGKKKLTLASLNSKLNNMLSAKKINITAALSSEVEKQKRDQQRKLVQIEYDPQNPNSYELAKHNYANSLSALAMSDQEEDEVNNQPQSIIAEPEAQQQWEPQQKEQIALRMMQKFGFKVGQGLGKQSQGIRTPLIVRKTTDSSGIIQQSSIPLNFLISPQVSAKNALAANNIELSQVIVLSGLLSMEQLAEDLEEEIKQECCIYGIVCDWILYCLGGQLRIFVEFQDKQQSINAFIKMNGKYFGQRLVSVRFYPKQNFKNRQLDLPLHSHIPT